MSLLYKEHLAQIWYYPVANCMEGVNKEGAGKYFKNYKRGVIKMAGGIICCQKVHNIIKNLHEFKEIGEYRMKWLFKKMFICQNHKRGSL